MPFNEVLRNLRLKRQLTQEDLSKATGLSKSAIGMYESGKRNPNFETLELLADYFNVDMNTLLGKQPTNETSLPELTPKDERQIANDLEDMLNALSGDNAALAMYNSPEDEEDLELLKASLMATMTLAKRIAKKKYTPKKYRK